MFGLLERSAETTRGCEDPATGFIAVKYIQVCAIVIASWRLHLTGNYGNREQQNGCYQVTHAIYKVNHIALIILFLCQYHMVTSTVKYLGDLRSEAVHAQSGSGITTDAPRDNHGLGEAFSPTDLVATALATCMFSIMGIVARREGMTSIDGATAEVTKIMYPDPRRIGEIHIKITMPRASYSEKEKKVYEHAAFTCPVAKSIHPDIKQVIEFLW